MADDGLMHDSCDRRWVANGVEFTKLMHECLSPCLNLEHSALHGFSGGEAIGSTNTSNALSRFELRQREKPSVWVQYAADELRRTMGSATQGQTLARRVQVITVDEMRCMVHLAVGGRNCCPQSSDCPIQLAQEELALLRQYSYIWLSMALKMT